VSDLRTRIESAFAGWARTACRHRFAVSASALAFAALFAFQVPDLQVNNSSDSFLHPSDPIRVQYDGFREQFGRDTRITLAIESDAIFSLPFLEKLRALHDAAQGEVPYLEELTSLVNARDTRAEGDTLIVGGLLDDWPRSEADLARLRERVRANPLYRNTLISDDGRLTTLSILLHAFDESAAGFDPLAGFDADAPAPAAASSRATASGARYLSEAQLAEAVGAAQALAERFAGPDFRVSLAGAPVLDATLSRIMRDDIRFFIVACLAAIAVMLALLFRRPAAVALPIVVIVLSLVTTLGVIGLSGSDITFGTQILPTFLMAVGVCDAVHILAIFYLARGRGVAKTDAIAHAFGHSALAIGMTSLTTAGGLASFAAADLAPIADLGYFAPVGVMLALGYTVFLMPALMALLPMGAPRGGAGSEAGAVERVLRATGVWSARHRLAILLCTGGLVAASLAGASFLRVSHDPMQWMPAQAELRQATFLVNDRLGGVNVIEVVVTRDEAGAVRTPAFLAEMAGFERFAGRYSRGSVQVAQTLSLLDVLRETHQALNGDDPAFYRVPDDRELIAQELLLFEGSGTDDLEELVDTSYRKARMSLRVPWVNALHYPAILRDIEAEAARRFGDGARVDVTGMVPMLARTFESVLSSMARSYAIAIAVIVPMMMLLLGSLRLGLLSMVPNLTPIALLLGYMGWSGTPIDGMTMTAGAIMLGLAVDDTIHYMHNFRRSYVASGDSLRAIDETLTGTGRALLVTSLVLAAGFTVFVGGYLANVRLFGLLTAATILLAFVSNIVVGSALMSYASEWGIGAGRRRA
jgi:hypothetical protein